MLRLQLRGETGCFREECPVTGAGALQVDTGTAQENVDGAVDMVGLLDGGTQRTCGI